MPQFKKPSIQTPTFPESPFGQTESAPFPLSSDQQTSAYLQGSAGYIESAPFSFPWAQQTPTYLQESHGYIEASPFPLSWGQQTPAYLQEPPSYPYPEGHTQFRSPSFLPSRNQTPTYPQQPVDVQQRQSIYSEQQSLLYAQQQPLYQPVFQQPAPPLEAKKIQTKKKSHNKVLWIGLVLVIVLMVGLGALASQAGNNSTSSNIRTTTSNASGSTGTTIASKTTRISGTPTANSAHATGTPAATASQVTGTPTNTINTTASGSWTTVNSYTGSGIQQTKTFAIGNDWKILWYCQGPDVDGTPTNGVLGVFIHAPGKVQPIGVPVKVACPAGTTPASGSLEEHSGGTIYLIIAGTSSWSIQIQQLK